MQIFAHKTDEIIHQLGMDVEGKSFDLLELGPGDGAKTIHLLKRLVARGIQFVYHPADISQNALDQLEEKLNEELPTLKIQKQVGDYFDIIAGFQQKQKHPRSSTCQGDGNHCTVVLFLGSNIGNMTTEVG